MVNEVRLQWLNKDAKSIKGDKNSSILYWMFRDRRAEDNWALSYAQELAQKHGCKLAVLVTVIPGYMKYTLRHYSFMLKGLDQVHKTLVSKNISFSAQITKDPVGLIHNVIKEHNCSALVTDFLPLREKLGWDKQLKETLGKVPFVRVDAHNIVPCWETSPKAEFAARTIRPKVMKRLDEFLKDEFQEVAKMSEMGPILSAEFDALALLEELKSKHKIDCSAHDCEKYHPPGADQAWKRFDKFLSKTRLGRFDSHRNDPNHGDVVSGLSPYVNFGQVSIHRAIVKAQEYAKKNSISSGAIASYVEEAVVRRELSDNFCFYNPDYDNLAGAAAWAKKTLDEHRGDKREHLYTLKQLKDGKTADPLWNASQNQLMEEGKLHGFLRMYWAKKVLEWNESPEQAMEFTQYLNDAFSLDGNDPNGFVGVGWSIMGIHDHGWTERPVFGKIRYMNYNGCKRKFDVDKYVAQYGGKQTYIDEPKTKKARKA